MNPAALKTHGKDLEPEGVLIVNRDAFVAAELAKAGYAGDPLADGSLRGRRLISVPITALNREAVADRHAGPPPLLSQREADRCKNFFALGLVYWLLERPLEPTLGWIDDKFAANPAVREANRRALRAGCHYGEITEQMPGPARRGMQLAIACPAATAASPATRRWPSAWRRRRAQGSGLSLLYAAYPIAPASDVLHRLAAARRRFKACAPSRRKTRRRRWGRPSGRAFGGHGLGVTATWSWTRPVGKSGGHRPGGDEPNCRSW